MRRKTSFGACIVQSHCHRPSEAFHTSEQRSCNWRPPWRCVKHARPWRPRWGESKNGFQNPLGRWMAREGTSQIIPRWLVPGPPGKVNGHPESPSYSWGYEYATRFIVAGCVVFSLCHPPRPSHQAALFHHVARANHHCRPNSAIRVSRADPCATTVRFVALRRIAEGEEVGDGEKNGVWGLTEFSLVW